MRSIVIVTVALLGCDLPTTGMVSEEASTTAAPSGLDPEPDWTPAPPFGRYVADYEFFSDSVESTFDSIGDYSVGLTKGSASCP